MKLARQHFEAGDYTTAKAVLDAEQMGSELDALLRRAEELQQQQSEVQALRTDKAHEYLILARLTAVDFAIPNRFEQTGDYFEQSLKASQTLENTFAYAYFLQEHNQFTTTLPWYEEALRIYRRLAKANPQAYLPYVAMTAMNLSIFFLQSLPDRERSLAYAVRRWLRPYLLWRHCLLRKTMPVSPCKSWSRGGLIPTRFVKRRFSR